MDRIARALDGPFVYDDSVSIVYNPSIVRLWPPFGDETSPGPLNPPRDNSTAGRPLANLSLALNYHWGRLNPRGYHVLNVMIHTFSSFLLWGIVRRTLRTAYFKEPSVFFGEALAFCVAILWALHPLQTEAVEYVTQRTELLMAFCYLATLYLSLRYWGARSAAERRAWLTLSGLACLSGMACKEVMVSAPIVVLLFERTFVAGSFRRALTASWPLYAALSLGWVLLAALNYGGPRSVTAGFHLGVPAQVWWYTQCKVLLLYLKLAAWPWPLVIHYDMPYLDTLRTAWPWLLAVVLLGFMTVILLGRGTASGFLLASVFVILSPTLAVPITTELAAERRMYLPLAALVTLVVLGGYGLARGLQRFLAHNGAGTLDRRIPLTLTGSAAVVVAVVYGVVSARRLEVYRDAVTLWQDTAIYQPRSPLVQMNLGLALMNAGRPHEAIEHYELLLRLEPEKAATHHNNLGYALGRAGARRKPWRSCGRRCDSIPARPRHITTWRWR